MNNHTIANFNRKKTLRAIGSALLLLASVSAPVIADPAASAVSSSESTPVTSATSAAQTQTSTTSGSGVSAPSIVDPSGAYFNPPTPISPTSTPSNSAFAVGQHLPILITGTVGEVYDDNIYIQPVKVSDFITQLNLVLEYRAGNDTAVDSNYFDIFYAPSGDIYASHSSSNSFNQNTGALFQHRFSKLTLGISQTYNHNSATAAPVGNLVTTSVFDTKATAQYLYDEKFSLFATYDQNYTNYNTAGYSNSSQYQGDLYFLYHYDSKLSVGFGPKFGWLDVGGAPNQTYQDALGRVEYKYSGKLKFNLDFGVEAREYDGNVTGTKVTPVFTAAAIYNPWVNTTLTLQGQRNFYPSYNLTGQDYIATAVSLIGRQRFCRDFYYNLGFGYENDTYTGAGVALTGPGRVDNYYFATTGFDWVPNSWSKFSIYYKYQNDNSNFSSFSFNDNQVGISAGFSY